MAIKGSDRNIKFTLKLTPIAFVLHQRDRERERLRMLPNILLLLLFTLLNPSSSSPTSTLSSSLPPPPPSLPALPSNESCEHTRPKFKITKEKTVKALQEYIKATVKKKQMIKNTSTECSEEYVAAIKERNRLFKKTGNMSRQKVRMLAKKSATELKNKQQSAITPFQEWARATRKVWAMTAKECSEEYVEATDRFKLMRLAQENRRSMFRYRILKAKDKECWEWNQNLEIKEKPEIEENLEKTKKITKNLEKIKEKFGMKNH